MPKSSNGVEMSRYEVTIVVEYSLNVTINEAENEHAARDAALNIADSECPRELVLDGLTARRMSVDVAGDVVDVGYPDVSL